MEQDVLLTNAMDVFIRYGFRKASMDDVAAAVGMSRQAIYKRYSNKKDLFRSVIEFGIRTSKEAAVAAFEMNELQPKQRLLQSCFCWGGQHIERMRSSPHSFEVIVFANAEMKEHGEMKDHIDAMEQEYSEAGADMLVAEGLCDDKERALNILFTLEMASKGLFHWVADLQTYMEGIAQVINTILPDGEPCEVGECLDVYADAMSLSYDTVCEA